MCLKQFHCGQDITDSESGPTLAFCGNEGSFLNSPTSDN